MRTPRLYQSELLDARVRAGSKAETGQPLVVRIVYLQNTDLDDVVVDA